MHQYWLNWHLIRKSRNRNSSRNQNTSKYVSSQYCESLLCILSTTICPSRFAQLNNNQSVNPALFKLNPAMCELEPAKIRTTTRQRQATKAAAAMEIPLHARYRRNSRSALSSCGAPFTKLKSSALWRHLHCLVFLLKLPVFQLFQNSQLSSIIRSITNRLGNWDIGQVASPIMTTEWMNCASGSPSYSDYIFFSSPFLLCCIAVTR